MDGQIRCASEFLIRMRWFLVIGLVGLAACGPGREETVDARRAASTGAGAVATGPLAATAFSHPAARPGEPATPNVMAQAETVVADNPTVDADDPVLWADPANPARALLIGADKSIGLYVHDLSGAVLQFLREGPLNNVDLRDGFMVDGQSRVLVAATERDRFSILTWLLDPATLRLSRFGAVATPRDFGEPYGFCMGRWDGRTWLVANNKDGAVLAWTVEAAGGAPRARLAHRWQLGSQTEGCVVDDATGALFVGEEDAGIWRMSLAQPAAAPARLADADGARLVADVEGLTLMRDAGRTFLIASSQGDSAYGVWRLDGDSTRWIGRFRIGGGAIDPVTQTDGLAAWQGAIGPFAQGAIAVHDHCDGPGPQDPSATVCDGDGKQQNYKLVDWRDVKAALAID